MISERDVLHIAELADIGITREELGEFTGQFNDILDYFDLLDRVEAGAGAETGLHNVFRDDEVVPSLTPKRGSRQVRERRKYGFFRAPRVM